MDVQTQTELILGRGLLLRSPAKVNLYLRIGPRRQDGFHTLVSMFCSLSLCDELAFTTGRLDGVSLTCDRPDVPSDERNVVVKAGKLLRPLARRPVPVHIDLRKRIPAGGGLGGGSSNAAIALRTLAKLWDCELNDEALHRLAGSLGSDVPFFLHLPAAICRGRGELVEPVTAPPAKGAIVFLPNIAMPTAMVYRKFDELGLGTDLSKVEMNLPRTDLGARDLLGSLVNDLEQPAFAISPALGELREAIERDMARPVRMSGSGSTLFTIYDTLDEAQAVAARYRRTDITAVACELGYLPEEWPTR